MSPFALRRRMQLFIDIARQLAANPQLLRQIVFGYEEGTWDFATVEAVGPVSCMELTKEACAPFAKILQAYAQKINAVREKRRRHTIAEGEDKKKLEETKKLEEPGMTYGISS